jgi:hypothetical protein
MRCNEVSRIQNSKLLFSTKMLSQFDKYSRQFQKINKSAAFPRFTLFPTFDCLYRMDSRIKRMTNFIAMPYLTIQQDQSLTCRSHKVIYTLSANCFHHSCTNSLYRESIINFKQCLNARSTNCCEERPTWVRGAKTGVRH